MNHYCIVYEGTYNEWYSYIRLDDVKKLAKYLNDRILKDRYYVLDVYLADNIDSATFGDKIFFPTEYNSQHFIESYEERLLEKYCIEKLAI